MLISSACCAVACTATDEQALLFTEHSAYVMTPDPLMCL